MDNLMKLLLVLMFVDIVSGFLKGIYTQKLNSQKMYIGGIKKISMLIIVIVAVQIETLFGNTFPLREITITYYIVNEGLSFIENIGTIVPLPDEFSKFFKQIQDNKEE